MTDMKEISRKEFAVYLGYGLGIFLMLFGAIMPWLGEQIWLTLIGGILVLGSHQSYEAMVTRKVIFDLVGKKE